MGRHDELMREIRELVQPWLDELRRTITSSQTVNERGAHRVTVPSTAAGSGKVVTTVANELKGYAFRETTGGAGATVILRDGGDRSGDEVIPITLSAGESVRDWFSETGIAVTAGVYVDVVAGNVDGAVFLRGGGAS